MLVIGEGIHIISEKVKSAVANRDKKAIQELALSQVDKGAHLLDLNIGPQKKAGVEVMSWMLKSIK